ncbi:adenosylcobinamide-GDP ribazoletransferase [Suicoccus acidiformans]|nr:adenosylcobinamide-GDP ribazoletransferase [Suicoccus acidiformans]
MLKSIILFFQFFTVIPINYQINDVNETMRGGVQYLGLFGLLYGSILAIIYSILRIFITIEGAWLLTLFVDVLLTNGFHHDGFADMADGMFSSRPRERILEIMKDSRMGSNGTIALIFYFMILWQFGSADLANRVTLLHEALIVMSYGLVVRGGLSLCYYKVTYVSQSKSGLGSYFEGMQNWQIFLVQVTVSLFLFLAIDWQALVAYLLAAFSTLIYRQLIYRKIGGMNGDTMGAGAIFCQILYAIFQGVLA